MKKKMLFFKKFFQIEIRKKFSQKALKTICLVAFLIFNTAKVSAAADYTWVGGNSANQMDLDINWNPASGPPGFNDNALFTTDSNPPILFSSGSLDINNIEFFVSGVVCTIEGDFTIEGDVQNSAQVTSTFNIQNGGTFDLEGGSLATGGVSIYNLNASTLVMDNPNQSSSIVNMQNGSLFNVNEQLTIASLSSASTSDSIVLQADLTFGDSSNQVINGVISGTGNLIKQGAGTVTLYGTNTFNGSISILDGKVKVNGVVPGNWTVFPGATFGGTGVVGGTLLVDSGATLSPGNSIGTVTVGALILVNGSTTVIEIDPTHSSAVIVNGPATLAGTLNILQDPGTYAKSGSYQIISATSITNGYDSITGGLPGFVFTLSNIANDLFLNYTIGISTTGLSGNNLKVADYLNAFAPISTEFVTLSTLSGDPLNEALGSISPARNAFTTFASQQTAFSLSSIVSDYLSDRRFLKTNCGCEESENICSAETESYTLWGGGFFQHAEQSAQNENPKFQFNSESAIIGIDYSQTPDFLFGGAFSYAYTHLNESENAGKAAINYYSATIYGMMNHDGFYVEPALWGIYHRVHNQRHIFFPGFDETATAKFNGWQMISHLGFGRNDQYCFGEMEPFAAFDWVINWEDSFQEHGAGDLDMRQKAQTSSMLQSEIGVRFYEPWISPWGLLAAKESFSYINRTPFNTGKVTAAIAGTSSYLTLKSLTSSQNLAAVNFELLAKLGENQNYTASLEYEGQFGAHYASNAGVLKISVEF